MPNSVLGVSQNPKIDLGLLLIISPKNWVFHTSTQIRAMQKPIIFTVKFFHAKVQFFLVESKRQRLLACIGGSQDEGREK